MNTSTFQGHDIVEVETERAKIRVAPQYGARLLTWDVDGEAILRWPDDADWSNINGVRGGNPILWPFVARHMVEGEIGKWQDETGRVRALPMHGLAKEHAFSVVPDAQADTLRLRLTSDATTREMYPFDWRFDVVYHLDGASLEARFETENLGREPLPYYAGHHWYFALPAEDRPRWQLHLPCEEWGRQQQPEGSINREPATHEDTRLDDPAIVDRFHIGPAQHIGLRRDDGRRIDFDLASPTPWYNVTTWTQNAQAPFFCVEPWLGLPNAIHHGEGLRHLAPGQTEVATHCIAVSG